MTTFSKTPPTEPGWYYWRKNSTCVWKPVEVYGDKGDLYIEELAFQEGRCIGVKSFGGEWGGRIPEPGTTWTVEEYQHWLELREYRNEKEWGDVWDLR